MREISLEGSDFATLTRREFGLYRVCLVCVEPAASVGAGENRASVLLDWRSQRPGVFVGACCANFSTRSRTLLGSGAFAFALKSNDTMIPEPCATSRACFSL